MKIWYPFITAVLAIVVLGMSFVEELASDNMLYWFTIPVGSALLIGELMIFIYLERFQRWTNKKIKMKIWIENAKTKS